jgi:hypothetical protein
MMFYVKHKTENFPTGLLNLKEMARDLLITAERLLSYVESGHCPHLRIDDGEPFFLRTETRRWAAKNLIKKCDGKDFPSNLTIIEVSNPIDILTAPQEIRFLKDLRSVPYISITSGIYFLCKDDEVMYIGQAKSVHARVGAHIYDGIKDFNKVYFIPVPTHLLNEVEGTLIRQIKPKLNGMNQNGVITAPIVEEHKQLKIMNYLSIVASKQKINTNP